jgi:hypothetical protein
VATVFRANGEVGVVHRFGTDLFYANADRFADEALALIDGAPAPVRRFVVDASAMTDMDF